MFKSSRRFFSDNIFLFLGILIGLYISAFISDTFDVDCKDNLLEIRNDTPVSPTPFKLVKLNQTKKSEAKKTKLIRPRYYSTELGIRENLFVGIFSSENKVNTQAVHLNRTLGHLVGKIKFFITAAYKLKSKFNLTGLVGFTDARHKFRPFQVLKYVGDNFLQDFDYYLFANDYTFINGHRLNELVRKISVGNDVYLGTKVQEGSYCNLDSGIIISNSVLKAVRSRLDWCILNAVSDDHSENLGRCVYHSLALNCQESIQEIRLNSFKIKHFNVEQNLKDLSLNKKFNEAVTVYPIIQKDDFYLLNTYFLKQRMSTIKQEISLLSASLTNQWPAGHRHGSTPATRYDVVRTIYFNESHSFFSDDFTTVREQTEAEKADLTNILEEILAKTAIKYKNLRFRRIKNGYYSFDLARGMDYTFDVGFRDTQTGKEVVKRFEVCKPLGKVEFLPVPYVTENTRVTVLLPVQETEVQAAVTFVQTYIQSIMDRKEKTFLMLVLLYQAKSSSKGKNDVFNELKQLATKASSKYKNEDNRIAWVSVRLPEAPSGVYFEQHKALSFVTVDLALKRVGIESLMLFLDVNCNITVDFLNRVRMNTILNYQIFSPIPFRQYNPKITQTTSMDVTKNTGHFDREEYKYISFYGRDYVHARKKYQHIMPLFRTDNDIETILHEDYKSIGNIFEMFLKFYDKLHCMRASDMNLKLYYREQFDESRMNWFLGNNMQLAKALLSKAEQIPVLQ